MWEGLGNVGLLPRRWWEGSRPLEAAHWPKVIARPGLFCSLLFKKGSQPETVPEATRRGQPRAQAKSHRKSEPLDKKQRFYQPSTQHDTVRPRRIKTTSKCHEALQGHTREDFIPGRKEATRLAEFPAVESTRKSRLQRVGLGTFFEKTEARLFPRPQLISLCIYLTKFHREVKRDLEIWMGGSRRRPGRESQVKGPRRWGLRLPQTPAWGSAFLTTSNVSLASTPGAPSCGVTDSWRLPRPEPSPARPSPASPGFARCSPRAGRACEPGAPLGLCAPAKDRAPRRHRAVLQTRGAPEFAPTSDGDSHLACLDTLGPACCGQGEKQSATSQCRQC